MPDEVTLMVEGKVVDVAYYQTEKGREFTLVFVDKHVKPLAFEKDWKGTIPNEGQHVSIEAAEGTAWFFPKHRDAVVLNKDEMRYWKPKGKLDPVKLEQARQVIRAHLDGQIAKKVKEEVCSLDVRSSILSIFPERNPHIVGAIFLNMAKRGEIHKFGRKPSVDPRDHGSDVSVWHYVNCKGKHPVEFPEVA